MHDTSRDAAPAADLLRIEDLTARDWFATHAPFKQVILPGTDLADLRWMAKKAYAYADAMIQVRSTES